MSLRSSNDDQGARPLVRSASATLSPYVEADIAPLIEAFKKPLAAGRWEGLVLLLREGSKDGYRLAVARPDVAPDFVQTGATPQP
jgi:hypothetical protein